LTVDVVWIKLYDEAVTREAVVPGGSVFIASGCPMKHTAEPKSRSSKLSEKGRERILSFIFGGFLVAGMIVLAVFFPEPTEFQYNIFRTILSLSIAGVVACSPGFIEVDMDQAKLAKIRSGGALAVFLLTYFFSPASLITREPRNATAKAGTIVTVVDGGGTVVDVAIGDLCPGRWELVPDGVEMPASTFDKIELQGFREGAVGTVINELAEGAWMKRPIYRLETRLVRPNEVIERGQCAIAMGEKNRLQIRLPEGLAPWQRREHKIRIILSSDWRPATL
jgi:hypothetical protein